MTAQRLAIDYAWQHPDPAQIRAAGYEGVLRYLSNDPSKDLSPAEAKALQGQGRWIGLVFETVANRAAGGGRAGAYDVRQAEARADALGYPKTAVLFYAVDFDADPQAVFPYFQAIRRAHKRPVGGYGSARVVEALMKAGLIDYAWQTVAWSPSGYVSPVAHLYQRIKPTRSITGTRGGFDENVVIKHVPAWGMTKPRPKPKPPVVQPPTPKPPTPPHPRPKPQSRLVTAYANVRVTMNHREAQRALQTVLDAAKTDTGRPADVVGLGEWGRGRKGILRHFPDYSWRQPLRGGGPIGMSHHTYRDIKHWAVKLVGWSHVEPDPGNPRRLLGPSWATVVTAVNKGTGKREAKVLYHLTAGIQNPDGSYKDHPRRVARHKAERKALAAVIANLKHKGFAVEAMGDSNFDGLQIRGMLSARPPADLGKRAVSDVFGSTPALATYAVRDGSDHRGVIVVRG